MNSSTHKKTSTGFKLAASLALITVLGPSSIDMYLPSMPDMGVELHTSYANMQLTLTIFLLAMGAGQLICGPLIDALGRRRPLIAAIIMFVASSFWAATATSIDTLLIARFFQGLASSMTLVTAMSTVRDVASGTGATQLFALLMTIEGLTPVIAPAVGGYIDSFWGWRAVMVTLGSMGILALLNTAFNLPETLPQNKRLSLRPAEIAKTYARIACDGKFLWPALALSAVFFFLMSYISGAAFVYQNEYGLSPDTFGMVFGATGIAVLCGALGTSRWVAIYGGAKLSIAGVGFIFGGAVIAWASAYVGIGLPGIVVGMFLAMFGLGIAEATLMAMAMSSQETALGFTAALLGALQLVLPAAATPLAGALAEHSALAWLGFQAAFGIVILWLTIASTRRLPKTVAASAPSS
ncbi:MAG: multidrug effflux MFS transporter [Neisseriaceae bacterium]|nr:multidrug effflux MFS transporter [Neisseriaceae bacterium]